MDDVDISVTIEHAGVLFHADLSEEDANIFEVVDTIRRGLLAIGFDRTQILKAFADDVEGGA